MVIKTLSISNLRNHAHTELEFVRGVNVLHGLNGAGKTTVLEAIAITAFTRSFLPTADAQMVRNTARTGMAVEQTTPEGYIISATAESDLGTPYKITIGYSANTRKSINSTLGDSLSPKDVIGEIPMVILSPDFKNITFGSPQDRRSFLDRLLSQCSRRYLEELTNHKRILKQRNNLLAAKSGYFDRTLFGVWTEQFIKCSTEITLRRRDFLREFTPYFLHSYATISNSGEPVAIAYEADGFEMDISSFSREDIIQVYTKLAASMMEDEVRRGLSLFGSQKDDISIRINDGVAKDVASQGQHKSLLISMKAAEFEYLKQSRGETPILLLDDVFSELDLQRTEKVFDTVIDNAAQTFITTTEAERFRHIVPPTIPLRSFMAEKGEVREEYAELRSMNQPFAHTAQNLAEQEQG